MRLYIITKRTLFSIGFCLLIGVIAGGIALTSTVQAIQTASAQREIPIYCVDTDKKQDSPLLAQSLLISFPHPT